MNEQLQKSQLGIYVASSFDCAFYNNVIHMLRYEGYKPYNWKDNPEANTEELKCKTPADFIKQYNHNNLYYPYKRDKDALDKADVGILVLPSNKSAHLEAGYLIGRIKPLCIYIDESLREPDFKVEVMYKLTSYIFNNINKVRQFIDNVYYYKLYHPYDGMFNNLFESLKESKIN